MKNPHKKNSDININLKYFAVLGAIILTIVLGLYFFKKIDSNKKQEYLYEAVEQINHKLEFGRTGEVFAYIEEKEASLFSKENISGYPSDIVVSNTWISSSDYYLSNINYFIFDGVNYYEVHSPAIVFGSEKTYYNTYLNEKRKNYIEGLYSGKYEKADIGLMNLILNENSAFSSSNNLDLVIEVGDYRPGKKVYMVAKVSTRD